MFTESSYRIGYPIPRYNSPFQETGAQEPSPALPTPLKLLPRFPSRPTSLLPISARGATSAARARVRAQKQPGSAGVCPQVWVPWQPAQPFVITLVTVHAGPQAGSLGLGTPALTPCPLHFLLPCISRQSQKWVHIKCDLSSFSVIFYL